MVYGELSRYPLNIECTSKCILFWALIISGSVSKLSVKMYNLLYIIIAFIIHVGSLLSNLLYNLLDLDMFGEIKRYPVHLNILRKILKLDLRINTFRFGQMM